jgi:hypothetical protein
VLINKIIKESYTMAFKKIALYSVAAVVCGAGPGVYAHTGVKDQGIEGKSTYTAFTVTHGCATNEAAEGSGVTQKNVISVSALFPNSGEAIATQLNSNGTTAPLDDLSLVIDGAIGTLVPGIAPTAVIPQVFDRTLITRDDSENARGFRTWGATAGNVINANGGAVGLSPFRVGALKFIKTSCAKSLKLRIAVANWCLKSKGNDKNPARIDVWIGHQTAKFNDPLVMPYSAADAALGKVYWPTLTINRDLVANPLPSKCGTGFDVALEPSDEDIDTYLPMNHPKVHYWPN